MVDIISDRRGTISPYKRRVHSLLSLTKNKTQINNWSDEKKLWNFYIITYVLLNNLF